MKNKPGSHKSKNTFKFRSFSERIASVNIDVVHRVGLRNASPEDADTFFYETLTKWCELNCSQSFEDFKVELGKDVVTLNQLILQSKEIIVLIQKHLKVEGTLALQPLLELVVALSRDLLKDFYVHFPEIFETVTSLLGTKDVEQLEWIFTCLAYLFKFLWRYMLKDINKVFLLFLPLLGDKKPQHLRSFAAESFGFLLRKVSDKDKLLDFIFDQLDENPCYAEGIGQLLFEMLKGVQHQLHSLSEKHLPLLFAKLGNGLNPSQKLPYESILEAQLCMAKCIASHIHKQFATELWKISLEFLKTLTVAHETNKDEKVQLHLLRFLKVLEVFVEHRDGMLLSKPSEILDAILFVLRAGTFGDDCGILLFHLTACVLNHRSLDLEMMRLSQNVLSTVYKSDYCHRAVFQFTCEMFTFGMFQRDVFPRLLEYCQNLFVSNHEVKSDILAMLVKMLKEQCPFPQTNEEFLSWKPLKLDMGKSHQMQALKSYIIESVDSAANDDYESYLSIDKCSVLSASVYLLPYIKAIEMKTMVVNLKKLFVKLVKKVQLQENHLDHLLYLVTSTLFIFCKSDKVFETISPSNVTTILKLSSERKSILKTVGVILQFANHFSQDDFNNEEFVYSITLMLECNLSSPYHEVRLLTLEILAAFKHELPELDDEQINSVQRTNIFEICLAAEKISASIGTYREKLKWLQRLEFGHVHNCLPSKQFIHIPLRYLLGTLYINFNLLWEPILELVKSYATGLPIDDFWKIFFARLQEVVVNLEKAKVAKQELKADDEDDYLNLSNVFSDDVDLIKENADHENHRQLLWKGMAEFAATVEPKNRDISSLFMQFIKEEYFINDTANAPTQDISKSKFDADALGEYIDVDEDDDDDDNEENKSVDKNNSKGMLDETFVEDDDDDDNASDNETNEVSVIPKKRKSFQNRGKSKPRKPGVGKALCCYLKVFSKFRNPKAIHQEATLKSLYFDLLSHLNPAVQRLAFDCLFTYNEKTLVPYKETLLKLLDDKTFKTELTAFNIDVQSQLIQEEHRDKVLPVLMRILYGKMLSKTGKNTSGKSNANLRRNIIVRFLAGSKEQELVLFLNLAFQAFNSLIQDDALTTVQHVRDAFSVNSTIPLKKIQGSLNLLSIVFDKLGNLMTSHLPWLLKLLLSINVTLSEALERRDDVAQCYVNALRNLRTKALMQVVKFFTLFDDYPFSPEEIDAIFMAAVWPQLERLHFESLYTPTPLLQLFHQWSTNPRYFVLFSKHHSDNAKLSVLPQIMTLFTAPKIRISTSNSILELIENLLTLADVNTNPDKDSEEPMEDPDVIPSSITVRDCFSLPDIVDASEPPNQGTLLLLPHVSKILSQLKFIVQKCSKSKRKTPPERILIILTRISEYVTDADQSSALIPLLLSFLLHEGRRSETEEINILKTLNNLMKICTEPQQFVRKISMLFGHLSHRNARVALCNLMSTIASQDETFSSLAELAHKLNAWDTRRVDQPDYNTRLDAYHAAGKCIREDADVSLDYVILAAYNSTFHIRNTDDMSLRDSSSHLLQILATKLASYLSDRTNDANIILFTVLVPEIRKNLRSKNEVILNEFIAIFAKVIASCKDVPRLGSLQILLNEDPEIDFFENIRHIQVHRRARAMTRLARSGDLDNFKDDTMIKFLVPIVSSFFFGENYKKYPNIVDAAIELMGGICQRLSWYHYEGFVKHYLDLLPKMKENQKTFIKIIVAILDSFHFTIIEIPENNALVPETSIVSKENDSDEKMEIDEEKTDEVPFVMEVDEEQPSEPAIKPEVSRRIFQNIVKGIIPKLHKCLTKKTKSEGEHKLNRTSFPEDEEILRIPIALAMVKLLQKMPKKTLEQNLHGLFLKMCAFLKSRVDSIREATRSTLVKIMVSLGPVYFPFLLKLMKQTMTRGYQVHVMIFTLNTILLGMSTQLVEGSLNTCVSAIVEVCNEDLFGQVAEEKEVDQIVGKLKEARGNKSYTMYKILAQFILTENLLPLITPLKNMLATSHKHQVVNKSQECFHNIAMGMMENTAINSRALLLFCHGLVNETIPELANKEKKSKKKELPDHLKVADSYLIPPEPTRKLSTKTSKKTNAHVLVNFGLELLYFGLKRNKVSLADQETLSMLDPFIPCLVQCFDARHIKLITTSLRCLSWLFKVPLPLLKTHINQITSNLFLLLNKYAGSSQGENVEMVQVCFKTITFLVRDVDYHNISEEELQVLLTYVEHDILDYSKQATAFTLLKAILSRKLVIDQLHELMEKIAEMSILSDSDNIRVQCRQVFLQYLLDYPLGRKVVKYFDFFLGQLNFEHEYGRDSALKFMASILNIFPDTMVKKTAGSVFVSLSTVLVNDSSTNCRKLAHECLKQLLEKISPAHQDELFSVVCKWLQDEKLRHKRLAAQLCGLFVEVQASKFERNLGELLPILIEILEPDKFNSVSHEPEEKTADHLVYIVYSSFMKIIKECHLLKTHNHKEGMKMLWGYTQQHLLHAHTWVRLAASQLFGLLFSTYPAEEILQQQDESTFLLDDPTTKLKSLAQSFMSQFQATEVDCELANQIVKNLVYIAKVSWQKQQQKLAATSTQLSIDWLIKKMNKEARFEVANNPKCTTKRTATFKWLAAVGIDLGTNGLTPERLLLVLTELQRELSDHSSHSDEELKNLANEVVELIKKIVGVEIFSKQYAALQTRTTVKRSERKMLKAQQVIANPQLAVRKRVKKQEAKKESKKRRLERLRPTKPSKKRKLQSLAVI